jgi:LPS export ABC transporter permease LptF
MKLYEKYIASKIAHNFTYILMTILLVVWLTRSNDILQLIINNGIGIGNFFSFSFLVFPEILIYIIPVGFFVSTITVYMKLRQTSEIFALKNAGLDNIDLARPVFISAIFVTILHLFVSIYLAPHAKRTISRKISNFNQHIGSFLIEDRTFIHPTKDITIYADKRNKVGMLTNIFVSDKRDPSKNTVMFAEKGNFVVIEDKTYLNLFNGRRQLLTPTSHTVIEFDFFSVSIDINKTTPKPRKKFANEMGIIELITSHKEGDSNIVELYNRLSIPLLNIILATLSLGMVLKFYRSGYSTTRHIATYLISFSIMIIFVFLARMSIDKHQYAYISCAILILLSILAYKKIRE